MALLQTRVTVEEERRYKAYAKSNGMSMSDLLRRSLENEVSGSHRTLKFGCRKGDIVISDDFNSPMEEFEGAFYEA
jgi:hypothetical protein